MKNMKVSAKLIVSFAIMIAISVLIGVVGIAGMSMISSAGQDLYDDNYIPTTYAADMVEEMQKQRVYMRDYIIYSPSESGFSNAETNFTKSLSDMQALRDKYYLTMTEQEDKDAYAAFSKLYDGEWISYYTAVHNAGLADDSASAKQILIANAHLAIELVDHLRTLQDVNVNMAADSVKSNQTLATMMTYVSLGALVAAVVIAVLLTMYISRLIANPLHTMHDQLVRISSKGDLSTSREDEEARRNASRDEIGQCIEACGTLVDRFTVLNNCLNQVADGDLTMTIDLLSEKDSMGHAMSKMATNLNNIFNELRTSSDQVSGGSKQIADGAQSLAQGSTEQASAVEELSASINEVSGSLQSAAGSARGAAQKADNIRLKAEQGSEQMSSMLAAVQDINEASQSIGKVISVIDNIAFQTNILALNAAVEAARAGQHGRGFAVVAEEVRSLAGKSADAAQETGVLIQNSIAKAELGARIAAETSASLQEIVAGINDTSVIVNEIAVSAEEQAVAIKQINTGIDQVAQVVQQNSATAEESAAAAEEMSSQATMLDSLVAQFKLNREPSYDRIQMRGQNAAPRKTAALPAAPSQHDTYAPSSNGGYGKY